MKSNHVATSSMTSGRAGKHRMKQAREDANNVIRELEGEGEGDIPQLTVMSKMCSKDSTVGICKQTGGERMLFGGAGGWGVGRVELTMKK